MNRWCAEQVNRINDALRDKYANASKFQKSEDDDKDEDDLQPELLLGGMELPPMERHTVRALALLMWQAVNWKGMADELQPYLEAAAIEGVAVGEGQAGTSPNAVDQAKQYGADRSAEAIGMRRTAEGFLEQNPGAHWPLTDVFRRDFVNTAIQAVEEGWTTDQLEAVVEAMYALSPERMGVIAEAELPQAQANGTYIVWVNSETVTLVRWRVSDDPKRNTDECDDAEAQGIVPLGHEFFPGVRMPLLHPFCQCRLVHVPNDQIDDLLPAVE